MKKLLWRAGKIVYYLQDGIIQTENSSSDSWYESAELLTALNKIGYCPAMSFIPRFLDSLVGHSWDELVAEAERRAERNKRFKRSRVESREKWRELCGQFDGRIIGLDKSFLRIFPTGFAVRILLTTQSEKQMQGE